MDTRNRAVPVAALGFLLGLWLAACAEEAPRALSTCGDGILDGDETDVDCGGGCSPCLDGAACRSDPDCLGGVCDGDVCATPRCDDGLRNGAESDLDCGGPACAPCRLGQQCERPSDCASERCEGGRCSAGPTCSDGVRNGDETDVDCGGSCGGCLLDRACTLDGDCLSGRCDDGACTLPIRCRNGRHDGDETDFDCGGSCPPCLHGHLCRVDRDCASGTCRDGLCDDGLEDGCSNGVLDGDETDVDCGGSCRRQSPCPMGYRCSLHEDCAPGLQSLCLDGICGGSFSCQDGERNGHETGPDCGGGICIPCGAGLPCGGPEDCLSGECAVGLCTEPEWTCDDGFRTGLETDVDCGGGVCPRCETGFACLRSEDCGSDCSPGPRGVLLCDGVFACQNGVRDGHETDIDCGGPFCLPCRGGQSCSDDRDCGSEICRAGTCETYAATCGNGSRDGTETGVDCGGRGCVPCGVGSACQEREDCTSLLCRGNSCEASLFGVQMSEGSLGCVASGLHTIETGLSIGQLYVLSSRFALDEATDGYYVAHGQSLRLSETGADYSGILLAVDRSLAFDPPAEDPIRIIGGDHRERDCMSEIYLGPSAVVVLDTRIPRDFPRRVSVATSEFIGDAALRESIEGVPVIVRGRISAIRPDGGPGGNTGPAWWFELDGGVRVVNDFGYDPSSLPSEGTTVDVEGFVKQEGDVHAIVAFGLEGPPVTEP
jgi:hypothetical protein